MPSTCAPSTLSRRTLAPVATSAWPYSTSLLSDSRATRAAGSSFIALVRVRTSTSSGTSSAIASRSTRPRRYSFEHGGRSYGASSSRPTSRTLPSNPRERSSAAHAAPATPPPTSRTSTTRRELRRDVVLQAGVEHEQHLVARLDHRVGLGDEAAAVAQHRDDQRALGQLHVGHLLARRRRVAAHLQLDDLQPLLLERQQVHEPVARHLVLDQAQDEVRGAHRGLDAQQLEVLQVPRVVDARDDPLDEVLLLGDLADEHVVLVVARHRDHQVGPLDPGPLEHPQLGRVAVLHGVLELLLDDQVAAPVALDERDLLALVDELAREVPAHLAAADDQDVHQAESSERSSARRNMSIACWVGEIVPSPF